MLYSAAHVVLFALILIALLPGSGYAQTTAARPTSALQRTADGKPDLSGIWQVMNTAAWDIQDHSAQKGVPAGQGVVEGNEMPYHAGGGGEEEGELREPRDRRSGNQVLPAGRAAHHATCRFRFRSCRPRKQITILYEYVARRAQRLHDGTPHIKGPIDWWMGDSRGRWEGDTLVVDVIHFNDETWFDRAGNFHSDALHVVERYTPVGPDHINYEATIEDPKVFTRPWKMSMILYRHKEKNVQNPGIRVLFVLRMPSRRSAMR